jgi:hypothetical protein
VLMLLLLNRLLPPLSVSLCVVFVCSVHSCSWLPHGGFCFLAEIGYRSLAFVFFVLVKTLAVPFTGEYDFEAFTKSRTCDGEHPAKSNYATSRRRLVDARGCLPAIAVGVKRATDASNSISDRDQRCSCQPHHLDASSLRVGDCIQIKTDKFYPCEVCLRCASE